LRSGLIVLGVALVAVLVAIFLHRMGWRWCGAWHAGGHSPHGHPGHLQRQPPA
jgi:hypothetical protein